MTQIHHKRFHKSTVKCGAWNIKLHVCMARKGGGRGSGGQREREKGLRARRRGKGKGGGEVGGKGGGEVGRN